MYAVGWSHIYVIPLTHTNLIRSANKNVSRYNFITLGFIVINYVHNKLIFIRKATCLAKP